MHGVNEDVARDGNVVRNDLVTIPICPNSINHVDASVVCLVNMSAACFLVSMYSGTYVLRTYCSCNQARSMPCVRLKCLIVGLINCVCDS